MHQGAKNIACQATHIPVSRVSVKSLSTALEHVHVGKVPFAHALYGGWKAGPGHVCFAMQLTAGLAPARSSGREPYHQHHRQREGPPPSRTRPPFGRQWTQAPFSTLGLSAGYTFDLKS